MIVCICEGISSKNIEGCRNIYDVYEKYPRMGKKCGKCLTYMKKETTIEVRPVGKSKKKTPMCGFTTSVSEKKFKQQAHRAERRKVNMDLKSGKEDMRDSKNYGNRWDGPKDGKQWFGNLVHEFKKYFKELMRK